KKLYRDFIDIDLEIEKEFNMPTTEIFKLIGEEKFREKEKEYVKYYAEQPLKVISDRKSTRLNSSHVSISYAVFCLKKKNNNHQNTPSVGRTHPSDGPITPE